MNRNQGFRIGPGGALPPAIKNLLFANGVVYLMLVLNRGLGNFLLNTFAFVPQDVLGSFKIWQFVSYMFLHDPSGFMHILFNMLFLWMFGAELEREWGTREFLKYYFITGIGAAVLYLFFANNPMIGASGAVYGVMVAYALRYPDREIYIYLLFPLKVKYYVTFLAAISFLSTFGPYNDGIAHAAHLGGMLIGYVYLKYWYAFYKLKSQAKDVFSQKKSKPDMKYTKGQDNKTEYYRRVIDEILDKINRVGYLNLTDEEKQILEEGSKYLREHDKENYN